MFQIQQRTTNGATTIMAEISEIDAATAKAWMDAGEAHLVDVREDQELMQASIEGAAHVPMSALTPENIAEMIAVPEGKKLVLFCAIGQRSYQIGAFMADQEIVGEVYSMAGGLQSWSQEGLPVK